MYKVLKRVVLVAIGIAGSGPADPPWFWMLVQIRTQRPNVNTEAENTALMLIF